MKKYRPEGGKTEKSGTGSSARPPITLSFLERAKDKQLILEAPVLLCDRQMDLHIALGDFIGVIPKDEAAYSPIDAPVKDIAILTRVGKPVSFFVKEIKRSSFGQPEILLSRKALQKECYEQYIRTLRPGDVVPAKVTHIESFGAFLDIGCGINALLPIDAISVSRISHPRHRFSVGDEFSVVIQSIDDEGRIYVSRKELLGSWEENAAFFLPGQTVAGIVRSIETYGIFVELTPNLTGLAEYKDGVKENEIAAVYIKSMLPERMKIKLIIIDSHKEIQHAVKLLYPTDERPRHIDHWRYSPVGATKRIESNFS